MDYFEVDDVTDLNSAIYDGTEAGAHISVLTPDGTWHYNGDNWSGIDEIVAFRIGTIVEGSDAEINSPPFELPVTVAEVKAFIEWMEDEADNLWDEANNPDEGAPPTGPREWSPRTQ